ncbi:twin-arginine translocase subunit TatC [Martelella mediterranea]|uniref:Sec-independent protein translocase protein TatC n=1 Tax=Martelella mediterranea TaxID=293089 RepID=A0A4R3NRJ8_9HYPH|nr:twin-arginine translocase subunit TatC [Martelella mediterranea]TCT34818.1 Sec-independent protein translocase TatC [Martelella mediterranea]
MSTEDGIDDKPQPLVEHLMELRKRLVWSLAAFFLGFLLCFAFAKDLFNLLVLPYRWAVIWAGFDPAKMQLIYTAPQEFFFTQIKISLFGGLLLAFPVIAFQVYSFVAPGLYKNERSAFLPFLVASPVLFIIGGAIVYFFLIPVVMLFFLNMQQVPEGGEVAISLLPKVSEYLSLIMSLVLAFGLVFQLPVVTTLLARVGLTSSQWLAKQRKFAIVIAFIIAAVLTPPDPLSQLGLALPTILLYEVAIYAARVVERQRRRREVEAEETEDDA